MKNHSISVIALAIGVFFSVGATAADMSPGQYQDQVRTIDGEYRMMMTGCAALATNARADCIAEARGKRGASRTELDDKYHPTITTWHDSRAANAEADYQMDINLCDNKVGRDGEICVNEAKTVRADELADAAAEMKSSRANALANKNWVDARVRATAAARNKTQ